MNDIMPKLLGPFSIIKICNIKLIRRIKVQKTAYNWMDHSKQPTRRTKKILKSQPDFSRTCGFRGEFPERLNFQIRPSNITIPLLDFRQNPLKVKKRPF